MQGNEMRRVLSSEIFRLRSGKSKPERSNAIARAASVICQSIRIELQYCKMTGQTPHIPFVAATAKSLPKPKNGKK